jgi:excisionase family DNA binding protein
MEDSMERPYVPTCVDCKYFRGAKSGTCEAFPGQIPDQIWNGEIRHDQPISGDNGMRFVPRVIEDFLTVNDLAKLLNVDPKTIYRALWSKGLPAYKIGRAWRIAKRDLEYFKR